MRTDFSQRKRALRTALLVLLLNVAGMTKMYAQNFTVGNLNYSINDGNTTVTVTGHVDGTSATGSLIIPENVTYESTSYIVSTIGENAFKYCYYLAGSLVIPNSVTSIRENAFQYCYNLTGDLVIPNSVTSIGSFAFQSCSSFTGSLTIPNSVTSIDDYAFSGCSGLTGNLYIPNSVISIGTNPFSGCSGLEHIEVASENPAYDSRNNCDAIIETSSNVLITGCMNSTIPNSITTIGSSAFSNCSGLISLTIPNSITTICNSAFWGCNGLTSLTIPNSVFSIGNYAFYICNNITDSLTIPNSVTTIGVSAFYGCSSLTSLTIPNSITTIGDSAFFGCRGLTSMIVQAEIPIFISISVFQNVPKDIPVYVPCNSISEYQAAFGWNEFTNYIEDFLFHLTVEAFEPEHCAVSIMQQPSCEDSQAIVKAEPADSYVFDAWEEDGTVVSNDAIYTFTVDRDIHLIARVKSNTVVSESIDECIVLYPNPTKSNVRIETKNLKHVSISNMLGQCIYESEASGNAFEYDFSKHDEGIYLIRIETATGVAVKKISVTH